MRRMARSGVKWWKVGSATDPRTDPQDHPATRPERTTGEPDRCSPASTGTRWTTRDGSPSPRSSASSWAPGRVVSRWLDACLAIHTQAGWDELATKVAALPDHRPDRPPLPAVRSSRAPPRSSSTGRAGSSCRPSCATHIGLGTARPWSSGRATTRRSGRPTAGTTYGQALDDPQELAEAFQGLGI